MVIVGRLFRKIIRTFLCCVVYDNHTHTCVGVDLDFFLKCFFRLNILSVFFVSLDYFIPFSACFHCVGFNFFSTKPRDWLGRTSSNWTILCQLGRNRNSVNEDGRETLLMCYVSASVCAQKVVTHKLCVSEWWECIACCEPLWSSESCKRTGAGWCQSRLEKQGLLLHPALICKFLT